MDALIGRGIMVKQYKIEKAPDTSVFDYIVVATAYKNPITVIRQVEAELNTTKSFVLFDLQLCTSDSVNRYIIGTFKGETFIYPTFQVTQEKDMKSEIDDIVAKFSLTHIQKRQLGLQYV